MKWKIAAVFVFGIGCFWRFGIEKYEIKSSKETISPSVNGSVFEFELLRDANFWDSETASVAAVGDFRKSPPHYQKLTTNELGSYTVAWSADGKVVAALSYFPPLYLKDEQIPLDAYVREEPLWVAAYDFSDTAPEVFQRYSGSRPTKTFDAKISRLLSLHGGAPQPWQFHYSTPNGKAAQKWQFHKSTWNLSEWTWRDRELKSMIPKKWRLNRSGWN